VRFSEGTEYQIEVTNETKSWIGVSVKVDGEDATQNPILVRCKNRETRSSGTRKIRGYTVYRHTTEVVDAPEKRDRRRGGEIRYKIVTEERAFVARRPRSSSGRRVVTSIGTIEFNFYGCRSVTCTPGRRSRAFHERRTEERNRGRSARQGVMQTARGVRNTRNGYHSGNNRKPVVDNYFGTKKITICEK
jgi:hypothetical protein